MVLNIFFTVKTLGWRSIFLLTPRANGLMFQCLDASLTFTFLCLLDIWKHIFFHFLFLVHWSFCQSWVISQTKQKEWDFWVQAFPLRCFFWDESQLMGLIFLHLLEWVQRNISDIGVKMETILSTILGYWSIPSDLGTEFVQWSHQRTQEVIMLKLHLQELGENTIILKFILQILLS